MSCSRRADSDEDTEPSPKPVRTGGSSPGKKSNQPSKLVDLGAAASFASASQAQTASSGGGQQQAKSGGDALDDLFGDFSSAPSQPQQTQQPAAGVCVCVISSIIIDFFVTYIYSHVVPFAAFTEPATTGTGTGTGPAAAADDFGFFSSFQTQPAASQPPAASQTQQPLFDAFQGASSAPVAQPYSQPLLAPSLV